MVVSDSLIYYVDAGVQRSDDPNSNNRLNNLVNMEPEIYFINTTEPASRKSDDGFYYYELDGVNDYLRITTSDNPNINVRGDVTVGCWCRLDDNEPFSVVSKYNQYILGQNDSTNYDMTFIVNTTSWYPNNYDTAIWGDQSHIDKTKWHYWVGTYRKNSDPDQNGFTSLYCDGEPLATDLDTFRGNGDNAGVLADDGGEVKFFKRDSGSNIHQGAIGLIHCHSRALNAQEIRQNYISTRGRFQR